MADAGTKKTASKYGKNNKDAGRIDKSKLNPESAAMFDEILVNELIGLEALNDQHPISGANITSSNGVVTYIDKYRMRLFGSPFQFIDSVDKRFNGVNTEIGNEYLRNIILNSPILHIKPGMPYYTGGKDETGLVQSLKEMYAASGANNGGITVIESILTSLAQATVYSKGSRLQKRMFGFRESYYQYMQYVNYMCRSVATFLGLTSSNTKFPSYVRVGTNNYELTEMDWSKYTFIAGTKSSSPAKQLLAMGETTIVGKAIRNIKNAVKKLISYTKLPRQLQTKPGIRETIKKASIDLSDGLGSYYGSSGEQTVMDILGVKWGTDENGEEIDAAKLYENMTETEIKNLTDVMATKITSVLFMVEPIQFEESISNSTRDSTIESTIDGVTNSLGSEIAFVTGSNADTGIIGAMTELLGNSTATAAEFLSGLVEPVTGGFSSNLLSGALSSIKGQKMIYPKIYQSSNSEMNYTFTINLSTPYGDVYNYYMNILVPLLHLIALAAPRMVTANTVNSPFLVQAYVPGMCTCQLGIIQNMTITKNPNQNHVSVDGFPLSVRVTLTIQELYNSLAISPANDPASFLFNETLNDYMTNLAGLVPSIDTSSKQRANTFDNLVNYFNNGEMVNDIANSALTKLENFVNPFTGN